MNPKVQDDVFQESLRILGNDSSKAVTIQDINQMSYLEMVIKETLRIYPPIPFFGRKIENEFTAGGVTLPAGISVVISPFYMARDPKIFKDPLKFDPSRFDPEKSSEAFNQFAFIPFSAGPRNCVGKVFAMLQMKITLTKIIRNFEITIAEENKNCEVIAGLVLRPKNGIVLCATKRSN